ncbi:MAG: hypothetical protein ABMA14_02860 [Hyphomonadaceae bacterium]
MAERNPLLSMPEPGKRCGIAGMLLLVMTSFWAAACSPSNPDPVAYNGFVTSCEADPDGFAGSDCECVARALQANLDPSVFALYGRYQDLSRREIVYSDGALAEGSVESKRAHADMSLHYHEMIRKHASGSLTSRLNGLAEGLGKCGGAFGAGAAEIAQMFNGESLIRAFGGAR